MERDFGSWFHHQHSDWQSPNFTSFTAAFDTGQQTTAPAFMNPGANIVSTCGTMPMFDFSGRPNSKAGQPTGTQGWFYCMPRFRQAYVPGLSILPREGLHDNLDCNAKGNGGTVAGSGSAQKRFLVVDQSGDQTTLIFSSGIGTPAQCLTSWNNRTPAACNLNNVEPGAKKTVNYGPSEPFLAADMDEENRKVDVESDMREDTEELNALLDSDDEYYTEDEEETSTGHSPSTMTSHDKQDWDVESGEEVASSAGRAKKQKLLDGSYGVVSLIDTSLKPNRLSGNDAQSSCGDGKNQELDELRTACGNKRSRKVKIRETISILRSIIPNGKGKNAIIVLDEAINYLKSLKVKAKSLGLDAL